MIENILDQICAPAKGIASDAARKLVGRKIQKVRVQMEPRGLHSGGRQPKKPNHRVSLITTEDARAARYLTTELEMPVGFLYSILLDRMQKLTGLPEGN